MCLSVCMCTSVQVLQDPTGIRFPWAGVTGACELLDVGVLGTEFLSSGREVCTLDPWATFSASVFSMCVCLCECVPQVCRCLQRPGSVSDHLELELRQPCAAWHCCWELNLVLWKAATTLTAESSLQQHPHTETFVGGRVSGSPN